MAYMPRATNHVQMLQSIGRLLLPAQLRMRRDRIYFAQMIPFEKGRDTDRCGHSEYDEIRTMIQILPDYSSHRRPHRLLYVLLQHLM